MNKSSELDFITKEYNIELKENVYRGMESVILFGHRINDYYLQDNRLEKITKKFIENIIKWEEENDYGLGLFNVDLSMYRDKCEFGSKINNQQKLIFHTCLGDAIVRYYYWSVGTSFSGRSWENGVDHELEEDEQTVSSCFEYPNNGAVHVIKKNDYLTKLILAELHFKQMVKSISSKHEDKWVYLIEIAYRIEDCFYKALKEND